MAQSVHTEHKGWKFLVLQKRKSVMAVESESVRPDVKIKISQIATKVAQK